MLRLLAAGQEMGVRLTDLAISSGLNRATLHRILRVLVEEGAVEQEESSRIIDTNAVRLERYQLSGKSLTETVRLARERGHAFAPIGIVRGTRAVAVPILDPSGRAVAAISIAGMANRLGAARIAEIVALLREHSGTLSRQLAERVRRRGR